MRNSITPIESALLMAEERLAGQTTKNENERDVYVDMIRSGNEARKEVVLLKQQVRDLLLGREVSTREHHSTQDAHEKHELALIKSKYSPNCTCYLLRFFISNYNLQILSIHSACPPTSSLTSIN
jgi:hypothetical protein